MNKRSEPELVVDKAPACAPPIAECLRITETGDLFTRVFMAVEDFVLVDGDGLLHEIHNGERLLVLRYGYEHNEYIERQLDRAELTLHHIYGNRPVHEKTSTSFDIRTKKGGARNEDIPF